MCMPLNVFIVFLTLESFRNQKYLALNKHLSENHQSFSFCLAPFSSVNSRKIKLILFHLKKPEWNEQKEVKIHPTSGSTTHQANAVHPVITHRIGWIKYNLKLSKHRWRWEMGHPRCRKQSGSSTGGGGLWAAGWPWGGRGEPDAALGPFPHPHG